MTRCADRDPDDPRGTGNTGPTVTVAHQPHCSRGADLNQDPR